MLFVVQIAFTQGSYQKDIATVVIDYNPAFMKKYEYSTDKNYIVEKSYINYHIPINTGNTLIIKVLKSATPVTSISEYAATTLLQKDIKQLTKAFVSRVNTGATRAFLKITTTEGVQYYETDYTIYRVMNDEYMSYFAPPHFSFFYDLSTDYYPGQSVLGDDYEMNYAARFFFHGQTEVEGIQNNVLLKMYNDACANRPYSVITPRSPQGQNNIYKKLKSSKTGEKLYRSCQHPIQSEYLKGIGLYKEFYEEDGTVYKSNLVSVDDIPIALYLKMYANTIEIAPAKTEIENEGLAVANEPIRTEIPNNEYIGEETMFGFAAKGVTEERKIQPLAQTYMKQAEDKLAEPVFASKSTKQGIIHTVEKGETLYRLAKQYNTTVDDLKVLNDLNDNTIMVNQELLIRVTD